MFRTSNLDVINQCQSYFDFELPSTMWSNRVKTFDVKYATCGASDQLCRLWHQCQIVAIVSSIIITPVCLFNFFLLLIACMRVCVNLSFLR